MCVNVRQVFDHNGDGYISKLELHKTMNELGIELTRQDLDAMMDEADVNKDGRIDYAGTYRYLHVAYCTVAFTPLHQQFLSDF